MSLAPNRLLRQWKARFGIRKRVRSLVDELRGVFPHLKQAVPSEHSGGFDSIYFLEDFSGRKFGVLRLNNPHQKRKAVHTTLPRRSPSPQERIDREWAAYSVLGPLGLSPRPLWRASDAVVGAYSECSNLRRIIEQRRGSLVRAFTAVFNAIGRMHEAGVVHLDLSPGNVLVCPDTWQATLIDFEYVPIAGRSFDEDRCFDWQQIVGRARKLATTLGRGPEIENDISAAVEASSYRHQILVALGSISPTAPQTTH